MDAGMPETPEAIRTRIAAAMRRAWWPVARVRDLDRPRVATLLGEELVVFRTAGGRIAVASNRCPHRGAGLALGSVAGESIQCPYHGWEYAADSGRCTRIPSLAPGASIPPNVALKTYHSDEYLGLVWACLEEPAVTRPDPPELRGIDCEWEAADVFPVQAGVVASTENFRDIAHFAFVHRKTMGQVPEVVEPLNVRREGTEVFLERRYTAHGGEGGDVWESDAEIIYRYHTIAPSFVLLCHVYPGRGERWTVQVCSPTSLESCDMYWVEGLSAGFEGLTLAQCVTANRPVFLEDVPILNSLRPPEVPFDGSYHEFSTAADKYTLAVRRAFLEFVRMAGEDGALSAEVVRTPANIEG
jgi:phenylpropionate dioxygenase-like ring-hydroxylating dioxygenase large terminal subunit